MNHDYIPQLRAKPPVPPGAFIFAAAYLWDKLPFGIFLVHYEAKPFGIKFCV